MKYCASAKRFLEQGSIGPDDLHVATLEHVYEDSDNPLIETVILGFSDGSQATLNTVRQQDSVEVSLNRRNGRRYFMTGTPAQIDAYNQYAEFLYEEKSRQDRAIHDKWQQVARYL